MRSMRRRAADDARDDAVTPVIGSILILAITVLGITAVTVWGAPLIQELQERGSQGAMLGEFREIRASNLVLSITDSSRVPRITIDQGTVALQDGTRTMITSNHYAAKTGCDMHVENWGESPLNSDQISVVFDDCGTDVNIEWATGGDCDTGPRDPCFRVFSVLDVNTFQKTITGASSDNFDSDAAAVTVTITVAGEDFTSGDYYFELADDDRSDTFAEAWLLDSAALVWRLDGQQVRQLWYEGGAVLSQLGGTIFLEEEPALSEQAFGTDDFVLRLPVISGNSVVHSGPGAPSIHLQLVGNHLRTSETQAYSMRFDWQGGMAESWCNTIKLRNSDMTGTAQYTEDASYTCSGSQARKSLVFTPDANGACGGTDCFGFEFIHANIAATF